MAKKMGTNPLYGLNGLIRSTQEQTSQSANNAHSTQDAQSVQSTHDTQATQDAHSVHPVHDTQDTQDARMAKDVAQTRTAETGGRRKAQKLPRINMAFSEEHLRYLQAISGFERKSATRYVNDLIEADMLRRVELYEKLNAMRANQA